MDDDSDAVRCSSSINFFFPERKKKNLVFKRIERKLGLDRIVLVSS